MVMSVQGARNGERSGTKVEGTALFPSYELRYACNGRKIYGRQTTNKSPSRSWHLPGIMIPGIVIRHHGTLVARSVAGQTSHFHPWNWDPGPSGHRVEDRKQAGAIGGIGRWSGAVCAFLGGAILS